MVGIPVGGGEIMFIYGRTKFLVPVCGVPLYLGVCEYIDMAVTLLLWFHSLYMAVSPC